MKEYIFILSIGPVQSFISQARKLKDLFTGSFLLSHLTKTAMNLAKESGMEVKFPKVKEGNDSIPNRFVAAIAKGSKEELAVKAKEIVEAVQGELRYLAEKALDAKQFSILDKEKLRGEAFREAFFKQLKDHLDIQWAFHVIKEGNYAEAFANVEHLLGAVKNTRTFEQIQEQGRKCSLSGERNALVFGQGTALNPRYLDSDAVILERTSEVVLRPNEGLSAISFVKRFYPNKKEGFDSVVDVALRHFFEKQDKYPQIAEALYAFKQCFEGAYIAEKITETSGSHEYKEPCSFDSQYLYPEHLNSTNIPFSFQLDLVQGAHETLRKKVKDAKFKLNKYYAILCFDGDEMGKWLSGAKLTENTDLGYFHGDISERLSSFAEDAKKLVDANLGVTVYAGGDDYLGLLNLHTLFCLPQKLRELFEESVNAPLKTKFKYKENFTFSAGIAIAHYKTPLNIVLKTAKKMEHLAKEEGGRNAFALALLKHSGENHQAVYNWSKSDDSGISMLSVLEDIFKLIVSKDLETPANFSTSFIYEIYNVFQKLLALDSSVDLRETEKNSKDAFKKMFEIESLRLIHRSCMMPAQTAEERERRKEAIDSLHTSLVQLQKESKSYSAFLETLFMLDFLTADINPNYVKENA